MRPADTLEQTSEAGEGEGAARGLPRQQNPGASGAKELKRSKAARRRPGNGAGRPALRLMPFASETTLGNGYLGSRIDEERSEMRYLV